MSSFVAVRRNTTSVSWYKNTNEKEGNLTERFPSFILLANLKCGKAVRTDIGERDRVFFKRSAAVDKADALIFLSELDRWRECFVEKLIDQQDRERVTVLTL